MKLRAEIICNNKKIDVVLKQSTFPAGERYIKIENTDEIHNFITKDSIVNVYLNSADSNSIMDCLLLSDAISRVLKNNFMLNLITSYLPYSRQDRVCKEGESFSLSVFLDMITNFYDKVFTIDMHNPKVLESSLHLISSFIDNTDVNYSSNFINVFGDYSDLNSIPQDGAYFVAVDEGATNRTVKAKKYFNNSNNIIQFKKVRDNGKVKVTLADNQEYIKDAKKFIITDDIIDGGATFNKIAEALYNINEEADFILVASHGIFSAGLETLKHNFDSLFVLDNEYNRDRLDNI